MSQVYCWECEESFAKDEVLDIPVFSKGYTIKWCLNCVMKQLKWTDYRLIPIPKKYKEFKIQSCEDDLKYYENILGELKLCFENQIRKIKDYDKSWEILHKIAQGEF